MTDSVRRYRMNYRLGIFNDQGDGVAYPTNTSDPMVRATDYDELASRLAASEAEVADLTTRLNAAAIKLMDADNCYSADHAAAMEYFGQALEHDQWKCERDSLRDKLEALTEYVQHPGHCSIFLPMPMKFGQTYSNEDFAQWREKQVCNCGLAALQSSEKGL